MNSNLVPEQRHDKNGNIVTRWVRGMFSQKESARAIPKVTLGGDDKAPKIPIMSDDEALLLYDRLLERTAIPISSGGINYDMDSRRVIMKAFRDGDHDALSFMERFGEAYGHECAYKAAFLMNQEGLEEELPNITGDQLQAFKSFSDIAVNASQQYPDKNGWCLGHEKIAPVFCHALMHPEDAPLLERIVAAGVFNTDRAFAMLAELKEGRLAPVISEGFL